MHTFNKVFLSAIAVVMLAACEAPPDPRRANFEIKKDNVYAKYDPKSGRLEKLDADLDKNGKMETFSFWDGNHLELIQVDKNEDGTIDRWEHFGADNKMERVGTSSKDDGVEDTWSFVPDAQGIVRIEVDADRDGALDKREFWTPTADGSDRRLTSVELGFDKAGLPARRLTYRADGSFEKTEKLR